MTMTTLSALIQPGNIAVVTGASSGIGRAAALSWAAAGMRVYMLDIDAAELDEAAATAKGSGSVNAVAVDVADEAAMKTVADEVFAKHETVHVLFNNAGIGLGGGALTETSIVSKTLGVNFYGPLHGCLAFVPRMKEKGQPGIVINTGSKQVSVFIVRNGFWHAPEKHYYAHKLTQNRESPCLPETLRTI